MKSILALSAATIAHAAPHHETLTFTEAEFKHLGAAAPTERVSFSVALPWSNVDALNAKLAEVSNPDSPTYTQYMTQAEVNALTAPPAAARSTARDFFATAGAECQDMPHSLACTAPVSVANAVFHTKVSAFAQTTKGNARVLRVHPNDAYAFPDALRGSVDFVTSLLDFPTERRKLGHTSASTTSLRGPAAEDYSILPESLVKIYGTAKGSSKASQAPVEFQQDSGWEQKDLAHFATETGVALWNVTHTVGPNAGGGDLEATLDAEFMGATGGGNNNWYWTEADWQYEWVEHLAATPDTGVPQVFSMSWGWSEADQCRIDPQVAACKAGGEAGSHAYVQACNLGYAAAGVRGISIVISSGDSGAHGRTDGQCATGMTHPDFPTASPNILAVGATQLVGGTPLAGAKSPICKTQPAGVTPCAGGGTEVVASTATGALISSGGGFSNVSPMPAWQKTVVEKYLTHPTALPGVGNFNATSRGYPDVAALGHKYPIYAGGQWVTVDGTSCSAPVFGAVIALANAARLEAGKKVLGFLPPAIYKVAASTPKAFTDIVTGSNKCTENGCSPKCTGYEALPGWDGSTGLGTPNIPVLVAALAAL